MCSERAISSSTSIFILLEDFKFVVLKPRFKKKLLNIIGTVYRNLVATFYTPLSSSLSTIIHSVVRTILAIEAAF
jgi:hypothetical protein